MSLHALQPELRERGHCVRAVYKNIEGRNEEVEGWAEQKRTREGGTSKWTTLTTDVTLFQHSNRLTKLHKVYTSEIS